MTRIDDMDDLLPLLRAWMPAQRWYAAKGGEPALRLVDVRETPSPEPGALVRTLLVADGATLYQVPVVVRPAVPAQTIPAHAIGTLPDGSVLLDGVHDEAFTNALLSGLTGAPVARAAHVLAGEQSNTSVIYPAHGRETAVICKVFRQLHDGLNPDIELQTALSSAGSPYVPAVVGHVEGTWRDGGAAHAGSFAFAQEFLSGVEDAWRVALRAATAGTPFAESAFALGRATSAVHADLARLFPAPAADAAARAAVAAAWERRLRLATAEVPGLVAHADGIRAVYAAAGDAHWPALQRVHGDYHLGQVILVPQRGWVLLDFEGEPLRPIEERRRADVPVRDVAGMLRSFDYIAGSLAREGHDAAAWTRDARDAFREGYGPVDPLLLAAFELDKAVYEALYETRNRPDWVGIPLAAVQRLAAA
ncbi:maltokinase N-terminal cap-like domain-containing protein [Microbacterium sp. No. 7]|uniref:maltokinase N-terminal cap-like domain-containing protein n=1 Tax=Microbacterium sp. No. 7 TaxID=1714373 RepID=UPI0006ECDDB3|nr:aminoglycoside phosphotransferase [Microbacterium sp. No. 7]ALJ19984.1 aminoglycoside phosphotransferase [Microbacterium sp. No. 7]